MLKTFVLHLLINLELYYYYTPYRVWCFSVVNTTIVVVEKNLPILFKIEFYSNPVLNLFIV